jgi:hypothetical protein
VADWWRAHEAGERPVIYAHRRAQVDQLNSVCQRLRAEAGQLGSERLVVGDCSFAVGDLVVLGANAPDRLGVVNGTTAVILELELQGRAMTVRTLEDEPPRVVRLPGWYLDAAVRPGQSRRVDLAYARTDMRSQGRTEQRALLAIDGAEDMQGGYVQLSRSTDRTDLYLTVGPEPLDPDEERPHPRRERAPEEVLERVLTRDGSKTLASDTPDMPDVRRMSTRELRAERDRLAQLRAECPPDRSRELRLAAQRAADAEQARQQAIKDRQQAADQVAALQGRLLRRRHLQAARDRLALAEHALRTTTRQADQAAERLGLLRRVQQRRLGWLEAHDEELRVQERAVAREAAWRRRVDQRALVLDRRAGCWPNSARCPPILVSGWCGAWPPRSWTVTGAPTAWTTRRRRSMFGGGWPGTGGRRRRLRHPPADRPTASRSPQSAAGGPMVASRRHPSGSGPRPTGSARVGCLAPSPAATTPAVAASGSRCTLRWSGWPTTIAAAVTIATAHTSAPTDPMAVTLAARSATAANWQKGVPRCASTPTTSTTRASIPTTVTTRTRTWRSWARRSTRAPACRCGP